MMGRGGRELRKRLVGLPGLEPGDLILIRVLPTGSFPQDGTCDLGERCTAGDRWKPVANRSAPMACGPNVDQGWRGGRVARSCPSRTPPALRSSATLGPTLDRIGWRGTARPITAFTGVCYRDGPTMGQNQLVLSGASMRLVGLRER
jgi:hypothetical protein